jgi:hypothetical protein
MSDEITGNFRLKWQGSLITVCFHGIAPFLSGNLFVFHR